MVAPGRAIRIRGQLAAHGKQDTGFMINHVVTAPEKAAGGGAETSGSAPWRPAHTQGTYAFARMPGVEEKKAMLPRCAGCTCRPHAEGSKDAGK